jgi:hypothetical protein
MKYTRKKGGREREGENIILQPPSSVPMAK